MSQSSPCAACKFLRRKCTTECVFGPYFPPDQPSKFANVHRVFGASNVAKLLNEIPAAQRDDAVNSLAYEAEARLNDPVYGCVGFISKLQHRLKQLHLDLHLAKQELAKYIGPQALLPSSSSNFGTPAFMSPAAPPHYHHPSPSPLMMPPPPPQQQSSNFQMMGVPSGSGMTIRENTQQETLHRIQLQQMYVEAAQQQELLRAYNDQQQRQFQQQEVIRQMDGGGGVTATGFNEIVSSPPPMGVSTSSSSSSLARIGTINDHTSTYQQQQVQGQQQQQQVLDLKPQLFLQQQERSAGSEEAGRSIGPSA